MPDATGPLRAQLLAFARHVRDPGVHGPPPGVEDRRLRLYRELFLSSIEGLLAGSFPVIRRTLGDKGWHALVRDFYTGHRCSTPLFTEVAGEFVDWLAARDPSAAGDAPWLAELAHYEWVELELQLLDDGIGCGSRFSGESGSPLKRFPQGPVALSPLARPLAYAWPVHRIGPDHQPRERAAAPTLLLARRDPDGEVQFSELSPLVFRLLQLFDAAGPCDPAAVLVSVATEAGAAGDAGFLAQGEAMVRRLIDEGTLLPGR